MNPGPRPRRTDPLAIPAVCALAAGAVAAAFRHEWEWLVLGIAAMFVIAVIGAYLQSRRTP
jgi:hypothetical protein